MFRSIKSRSILPLISLVLFLGVAALSYTTPDVQGQKTDGEKLFIRHYWK